MTDALSRLTAWLSRIFLWFAGIGLVAMTVIISWQVFARYVLQASPAWAEQACLVLMIWYITLAAAAGVREGFHIRITALETSLRPSQGKAMRLVNHGIVGAIGVAMAVYGAELSARTWEHTIPTLGLPRGLAYVPISMSGVLIVLFILEHILAEVQGRKVEPTWS